MDSSQNHTLQVFIQHDDGHKEGFTIFKQVTCHVDSEVVPHLPSAVHNGQGVQASQRFVNLGERWSLVSLIKSIRFIMNLVKENLVLAWSWLKHLRTVFSFGSILSRMG